MDHIYSNLFDPITGDLLPEYRELYLHSRLAAGPMRTIEEYLKKSPIQVNILLGRYHELAEAARQQRRSFTPPQWVQQQLVFQPAVSKTGPLRRPLVQGVLAILLLLSVASVVQWIRNEPLVPAPVAAAVVKAAVSVRDATQTIARKSMVSLHLSEPAPQPQLAASSLARKPAVAPTARKTISSQREPIRLAAPRTVAIAVADTLPAVVPLGASVGSSVVEGHVLNEEGKPLAGATVMLVGSNVATSTNAEGKYLLKVPAGSLLQFAYAGCSEKLVRCSSAAPLVVMLEERSQQKQRASL
jgi:hypothetical protein